MVLYISALRDNAQQLKSFDSLSERSPCRERLWLDFFEILKFENCPQYIAGERE
jgi:hypothetical protein